MVDHEAETIRRIFEEYAQGHTSREIARRLNSERIAPPRGDSWNASTINGLAERGTGILRNELYVGRLIWNRVRMVKDPETGRRVSRPNPKQDWQIVAVPELTIVSVDLFEAARAKLKERSEIPAPKQRRARHLLSGLLRCAACGSGMSVYGGSVRQKRVCCTGRSIARTFMRRRQWVIASSKKSLTGLLCGSNGRYGIRSLHTISSPDIGAA
jgi:hypothetical protein